MRYSQIRAFHYVAISGGFSRAAEALSLTQPAVSEQVRKLEGDHDVLLFNRDRKQVTLTAAGERLLLATKQFFEVEQQISDVLSENRAALEGTLRIIADSAFHLTHRLRIFRSKHPKVLVSVRTGNTADILTALRNYDAEIGLVGSLNPGPDMEIINLGTSPIVAFASREFLNNPTEKISIRELSQYPLVFREKGSKTRQKLEEEGLRQGVVLQPAFEVEGREAVQEIVAAGAGIGFVSEAELGRDKRLIKLQLDCPQLTMAESLVHLKQRSDVRLIRAFMS
ncbi:aminoethylphosphonate catabolism LysR family transcriptional regulator [Litoreibacter meonggei]|uniref:Aminoethylphosphonate catabolism LysR family transcriptional regulator n=1 Tax=Litoreibacter meonggei TaxID=1049199 RepID=A0A497VJX5_9RHOB|nr:LysR substrate-binding domain-containing protein [Litoreibacter meonggei]RLJ40958.1 aminoethylphosphonate catabolism LysR family transcriptional regulator [Litoreibacter meonggei]